MLTHASLSLSFSNPAPRPYNQLGGLFGIVCGVCELSLYNVLYKKNQHEIHEMEMWVFFCSF